MLATLPPQQRRVVVMRYYADLSEREVADSWACRWAP
ncbi:sigma factor-like helix-turn-helix DNA-binding protein [Propioniciclava sinopodophylli]|nr:sigma-70 region 4 domain-containing protein [Propioniciclava sinopodophylli]